MALVDTSSGLRDDTPLVGQASPGGRWLRQETSFTEALDDWFESGLQVNIKDGPGSLRYEGRGDDLSVMRISSCHACMVALPAEVALDGFVGNFGPASKVMSERSCWLQ